MGKGILVPGQDGTDGRMAPRVQQDLRTTGLQGWTKRYNRSPGQDGTDGRMAPWCYRSTGLQDYKDGPKGITGHQVKMD